MQGRTAVVLDKTGTLTRGKSEVVAVATLKRLTLPAQGEDGDGSPCDFLIEAEPAARTDTFASVKGSSTMLARFGVAAGAYGAWLGERGGPAAVACSRAAPVTTRMSVRGRRPPGRCGAGSASG